MDGGPGVLQSVGSQTVGHDWATELNWTELNCNERWGPSIEKQSAHSFLHFTSHKYLVEHLDIVAVVTFGKTTSLANPRRVIVIHIYQENFPYFGLTNHESKMVRRWLCVFFSHISLPDSSCCASRHSCACVVYILFTADPGLYFPMYIWETKPQVPGMGQPRSIQQLLHRDCPCILSIEYTDFPKLDKSNVRFTTCI